MATSKLSVGQLLAYGIILFGTIAWAISFGLKVWAKQDIPAEVQGGFMLIVGWAVASVAREKA